MDRRITVAVITGVLAVAGAGLWKMFPPSERGEVLPHPQSGEASEDVVRSSTTEAVAAGSEESRESSDGEATGLADSEQPVSEQTMDIANVASEEGAVAESLRQVPVTVQGLKPVDVRVQGV